ncbi:MAG: hypothetical protein E6I75_15855 [Chloroflexi bacterium]|nr:MAG: hypothetical protein E6I75_15855 [Chloroflexota bacterium]TMF05222.1 MAG: hypothetical protein E6I52_03125 [Chloroflexota bacterium]
MTSPNQQNEDGAVGTLDGAGAGDNDQPYRFGRRPSATTTFPFSVRQYARLLVLRSRVDAGLVGTDDRHFELGALAA